MLRVSFKKLKPFKPFNPTPDQVRGRLSILPRARGGTKNFKTVTLWTRTNLIHGLNGLNDLNGLNCSNGRAERDRSFDSLRQLGL